MVKQADYVFAYVNTHYGGAYNALLYAAKHNKPYMNLLKCTVKESRNDMNLFRTLLQQPEPVFSAFTDKC